MVNKKGEVVWVGYADKNGKGIIEAEVAGQTYRLTRTREGKSIKVWDAIDTIKNMTTGTIKTMTRKEWCELFNKFN